MEMKYLREQDTGQIYLPVVHASGIVGLDTSGSSEMTKYEIDLTDRDQFISSGTLTIYQYSKMVFIQLSILFDPYTENDNSAYQRMLNGNTIVLDINEGTDIKDCMPVVLNTISYDDRDVVSSVIDTSVCYTNGCLTMTSSLKDNEVYFDEDNILKTRSNPIKLTKVVGSGFGLLL